MALERGEGADGVEAVAFHQAAGGLADFLAGVDGLVQGRLHLGRGDRDRRVQGEQARCVAICSWSATVINWSVAATVRACLRCSNSTEAWS
ncbi:hypothetical protein [Kribbella sp. NPDC000426]|uniref:hypothetical protein n=1 Tax=Kribbella sp. NPDC000426 TaxID=3154255 RepID=UPI00332D7BD6